MAAVRLVQRDAMCVITGTGSLQPMLERQVDEAGLRDHVRFLGHVADDVLGLVYRAATLSIVPSVALEGSDCRSSSHSQAARPRSLRTSEACPKSFELDPSAIVSPNDAPGLARRILDGLAGEISTESACLTYASRFAWPAIASRVAAIYREAAA
jgi:glycosyltransferase involved in cell wall biosynthesis